MLADKYYIDKITQTPADTLLAFGLTHLLDLIVPEEEIDPQVRLIDQGDCYCISLAMPIESLWVEKCAFQPLIKGLNTAKKMASTPRPVEYLSEQRRNQGYFEGRKKKLSDEQLAEQGLTPPHLDWPAWAKINQMAATNSYNSLIEQWHEHEKCFADVLKIILTLYSQRPNDVAVAEKEWKELAKQHALKSKAQAPQLQVVNPGMGKGANKSKASGLSIGGLNGFWLPEFLKFVGMYKSAIPRVVSNSKDRKTYILRPNQLGWTTHGKVLPEFQKAMYASTAIQMDILAALRYCNVFLQQWKAGQATSRSRHRRGHPGNHVAALEVISYKHLGSAHATMNLSTLVLPQWVNPINTVEEANQFITLLDEHETIIRNLNEKHSRERALLHSYRNFISARDLRSFYEFTAGYASYVMSKLVAGSFPPRRFHIPNLEVLIMSHNPDLSPIIQNPGFLRIAEAIRNSTVTPQFHKAKKNQSGPYEIRYGLGNDLLRNASYPEKFSQALSRFAFNYNQENGRVNERFHGEPPIRRKSIRTEDIDAVIALIDQYRDSETIANLLVAYGYAHDPRRSSENELETTSIQEDQIES